MIEYSRYMKISIIMPSYNMGHFIGEALQSIGRQSYENWEVIAVDDCGFDDGSMAIVKGFATRFPDHRVEWIRHEVNRGVSAARNTAILAARGEWFAFLDPDDVWETNHLSVWHQKVRASSSAAVVVADARRFAAAGQPLVLAGESFTPAEKVLMPYILAVSNRIPMSGVCARRGLVESVGGFDEAPELQHIEDWDLWIRLAEAGAEFVFTDQATCGYRKHPAAATSDEAKCRKRMAALARKHRNILQEYSWVMQVEAATKSGFLETRVASLEQQPAAVSSRLLARLKRLLNRYCPRT
jgi:glycosyltransferase involved in cell wall biosynthesis